MCSRAQCPTCHRPTFRGCGRHVDAVLGDVPPDERCRCAPATRSRSPRAGGLVARLLGRPPRS